MLLNYLNNIENIVGPKQAAPYQVCLAAMNKQA